ncbi:DUF4082 domain-containing protein [Parapedobacter defluvii]|uniref:DUF4082 domain-containing protein n=1 Tax=Parapedobacter defluvii TaxID=2045106 RepID=UPI0033413E4F
MKNLILLLTLAGCLLASCKKSGEPDEKDKSYPEERPLQAYFQNSGLDQNIEEFPDMRDTELGLRFTPKVKGKITAVTVRLPQSSTSVRVTIWNATTKHVLRTIIVPTVVAAEEVIQTFDALSIEPGTNYAISIRSDNWYHREKSPRAAIAYPINAGNFLIQGYGWGSGSGQTFPDEDTFDYYTGEAGFIFQQMP